MSAIFNSLAAVAAIGGAMLPVAQAHMSMWSPSMYGFNNGYDPVTPLANMGFNQWWFHGYANDNPREVTTIVPGQDLKIEIACSKEYSSWGGQSTGDACPSDAGSYHAGGSTGSGSGWGGNSEGNLAGCALAIAYKPTASQTNPEDFTVMSVQENCVRQRDTYFSIPSNLPACPEGGCTCAWFWQGKNSADEMYMIGFRCDVQGGAVTNSYPRPAEPRRNNINGATQPMYWANSNSNIGETPSWSTKPSYNSAWGWSNGAQTQAFGAGGGSGGGAGGGGGSSTTTTRGSGGGGGDNTWTAAPTTSTGRRGGNGGGGGRWRSSTAAGPDFPNYAAQPTPSDAESSTAGGPDYPNYAAQPTPTGGSGSGSETPCKKVRRRRSRTRRGVAGAAHHARNAQIAAH